ncbi:SpaA isopeptide-forming pilin-related protein [Levilactobacillus tujiorum]|uniref:LPXTG cell wall anchor domain-containing protein n=1 Tax=Levilactobacillus tujiorum TaxID=2912243 RepID=A0ABX1L9X8_9LACO|nr:SpaA isopeptide-forming pilin-related protein [Levilactobacillus tujiorum]MCH5465670.1 pilin N-terminal domain-containing protein [Levilactobacillus tujiorum]NLR12802.1 LPXTG cell wall anchor domain-containing protein [Lactobacillus sp. HBUAS51387]NLR30682.1 LPXTG cell wall anchor domain-containing protein [Levilactobacillus tujiorum]
MKFTNLRQFAVAVFAICGLALGGHATAQAASAAPDTVTMKLHKMENKSDKTIQNTGDEVTLPEGITPYDASKYGDVTYSIYDVTAVLKDRGVVSGQTDAQTFKEKRDQLIAEMMDGQTDPAKVLDAQTAFVNKYNLKDVASQTLTDNSGLLTFPDLSNRGFYLIMETQAPTDYLTALSAPMIIGLPLGDKATIHLYPKNVIAGNIDPEIHKVGVDPTAPTSEDYVALGGVEFELRRADGTGDVVELTTDDQGDIAFGNLDVKTEYVLTESSVAKHPWYNQDDVTSGKIELRFTVDKEGNVTPTSMKPDSSYFKINGTRIGILNHLILGGAEFKKVDGQDTTKGLSGAKFKVQKVDADGQRYWAVFDGRTFVKWVASEEVATELVSKADGTFDFTGVPYVYDRRDGKVTYNLIETQAPAGYALLKEATAFEINSATKLVTIKNERYALPITGGMGIWLFLIVGLLLMGGAGYLYYRQRRQNS